jgi:radical SAM protein with 4Fe4S-binding SPASM domain
MTKNRTLKQDIIIRIYKKINYWRKLYRAFLDDFKLKDPKRAIPIWYVLEIELQSDCNRDCHFCPRHEDRSGIRKDKDGKHVRISMPTEVVKSVLDQAAKLNYKGPIGFHRLSEPFLDKRYIEIVTYAKKLGLMISEFSNGDVIKNNIEFCKKIDGLIDKITIGLYDYKNHEERDKQMEFWRNRFKKTKVEFSLAGEFPVIRQNSDLYDKNIIKKVINNRCFGTNGLRIRYDGEVSLCCEDDQCKFNLGNVFNSSLEDIWWSEKHVKIIKELRKPGGRKKYPLCRKCALTLPVTNG